MKLLQITGDETQVWDALEEEAGLFGDNGGDPDGPLYLADVDSFSPNLLQAALDTGEAKLVDGYEADYAELPMKEVMVQLFREDWCGYGGANTAYFLNKADAELCQRTYEEWWKDNDLDTIAHRVHA